MTNLETIPEGNFLVVFRKPASNFEKTVFEVIFETLPPTRYVVSNIGYHPCISKSILRFILRFSKMQNKSLKNLLFSNYWPQFHKKCDKNVYDSYLTCLQFWFSFDLFWRQGKKRFTNYYFLLSYWPVTTVPYKRWQECLSFFPDLPSVLNFCETNIFVKSSSFFKIGKEKQINT